MTDDEEKAIQVFRAYNRIALPVVDHEGILLGIVTIDDIMNLAERGDRGHSEDWRDGGLK